MSHGGSGRAACSITQHIPQLRFDYTFDSTRRDRSRRWLWRLVRQYGSDAPGRKWEDGVTREPTCASALNDANTNFMRLPDQGHGVHNHTSAPRVQPPITNFSVGCSLPDRITPDLAAPRLLLHGKIARDVRRLIGAVPPNVKDEPRPWPARRVRHDDFRSVASIRSHLR
jgi:hypothetical protein